MDLRRLRMFIAVAEHGSITKAARYLHMEQPPLSRNIASMEEELGIKLFHRSRNGVSITHLGSLLLNKTIPLVRDRDNLLDYIKTLRRSRDKMLKIGFVSGLLHVEQIVRGLKKLRDTQPDVQFELVPGNGDDLLDRLLAHDLDIILAWNTFSNKSIKSYKIVEEEMYGAMPSWESSRGFVSVSYEELCSNDFILFPREVSHKLYDDITKAMLSIGKKIVILPEDLGIICLPPMVAAGLGNAIVPQSITKIYSQNILYFRLEPIIFCQVQATIRKENPSPLVKSFIKSFRKQ